MNFLKKIILILLFLFPISNSLKAMVTEVQNVEVASGGSNTAVGLHFNTDGSKMFVLYQGPLDGNYNFVEDIHFPHLLIFQQELMLEIARDVN